MKRTTVCALAFAVSMSSIPFAGAQSQGMGGMDNKEKSQAHKASGTVTKVDPEKSRVTVAHGPVQSLSWPAMTMAFKLKDKAMLQKLKKDQKVDFEFVQQGKDYVITDIR